MRLSWANIRMSEAMNDSNDLSPFSTEISQQIDGLLEDYKKHQREALSNARYAAATSLIACTLYYFDHNGWAFFAGLCAFALFMTQRIADRREDIVAAKIQVLRMSLKLAGSIERLWIMKMDK